MNGTKTRTTKRNNSQWKLAYPQFYSTTTTTTMIFCFMYSGMAKFMFFLKLGKGKERKIRRREILEKVERVLHVFLFLSFLFLEVPNKEMVGR